jgi:hypothetical protein
LAAAVVDARERVHAAAGERAAQPGDAESAAVPLRRGGLSRASRRDADAEAAVVPSGVQVTWM